MSQAAHPFAEIAAEDGSYFAAEDLLTMNGDGKVAHTPHSKYLHANMDVIAVFIHALDAGTPMTEALRQGKTPYEVRFGRPVFEHLADAPETAKKFAAMMSFMTSLGNGFEPLTLASFIPERYAPFFSDVSSFSFSIFCSKLVIFSFL